MFIVVLALTACSSGGGANTYASGQAYAKAWMSAGPGHPSARLVVPRSYLPKLCRQISTMPNVLQPGKQVKMPASPGAHPSHAWLQGCIAELTREDHE
jgi:hypothetical protein